MCKAEWKRTQGGQDELLGKLTASLWATGRDLGEACCHISLPQCLDNLRAQSVMDR